MNLGAPELMIILVVVLVLFGGAKLPQLARSLGQAQKEFRDGMTDDATKTPPVPESDKSVDDGPPPPTEGTETP